MDDPKKKQSDNFDKTRTENEDETGMKGGQTQRNEDDSMDIEDVTNMGDVSDLDIDEDDKTSGM